MRAYISGFPKTEKRLLAQTFVDIAELTRAKFLDSNSVVWADAEAPVPALWVLRDKSQYVYIHRCPEPQYIRVSGNRIRWAATHSDTTNDFDWELTTTSIAGDPDKNITLIVAHRSPNKEIAIIDAESKRAAVDGNGVYSWQNITIIDLLKYQGEPYEPPNDYERNHANYNGVELIMSTIPAPLKTLVKRHLGAYSFDISDEDLGRINDALALVEHYAGSIAEKLLGKIKEEENLAGGNG